MNVFSLFLSNVQFAFLVIVREIQGFLIDHLVLFIILHNFHVILVLIESL